MGISIAGISLADAVINAEFRIGVLERLVEILMRVAPPDTLTEADIQNIRKEVLESLKKKYPDAGIQSTSG